MTTVNVDVISIRTHLNDLKTRFDSAMLEGEQFVIQKKIYMEIKELECHLKVMEWDSEKGRFNATDYKKNHSHIKEQKPLL